MLNVKLKINVVILTAASMEIVLMEPVSVKTVILVIDVKLKTNVVCLK